MCKRVLCIAGGLAALSVVVFGRDAISYVSTSAARMTESVRNSVPVEFEIERARQMVKNLEPDIRRNMHVIAKEEVEIERLQKQIRTTDGRLGQQRNDIVHLRTELDEKKGIYRFAGRSYSSDQVKEDLANRFERYKTNEATLGSMHDILAARQRSLDAARQKLDGMLVAKRQLGVEVENLEARLKMVEVAQTTSNYNFDDSQLARARDLMEDIHTRLAVAEKLMNSEHQYQSGIMLDPATPDDIADQVTEYFQLDGLPEEQLAEASL